MRACLGRVHPPDAFGRARRKCGTGPYRPLLPSTNAQAWFNQQRTLKPQTFVKSAGEASAPLDPTDGGKRCDFCSWQRLTASDTWGRAERPHAVTGSNLFKYGEPCHGIVLFKHHDPLQFSLEQLDDFLSASHEWFERSAAAHPDGRHPFFLWNALPRWVL